VKTSRIITGAVSAAFVAAGLLCAAVANAETTELGQQGRLDTNGVVQGWTVSDLKKSTDAVDYPVRGTLWEATATNEALSGTVLPIISNLNARSASGETYRVLFQIASPQGVKPSALAQGEKTSGKIYFDVTGAAPDSVVYNDGAQDLIVWVQPAPEPAATPRSSGTGSTSAPATSAPAAEAETDAGAETEPDAAESTEAEAEAVEVEPAEEPVGRQGTPLPEDEVTETAPEAATDEGTPHGPRPASGSQGTPVEEGTSHGAAATTTPVPAPGS
jgi:hypothetical protein